MQAAVLSELLRKNWRKAAFASCPSLSAFARWPSMGEWPHGLTEEKGLHMNVWTDGSCNWTLSTEPYKCRPLPWTHHGHVSSFQSLLQSVVQDLKRPAKLSFCTRGPALKRELTHFLQLQKQPPMGIRTCQPTIRSWTGASAYDRLGSSSSSKFRRFTVTNWSFFSVPFFLKVAIFNNAFVVKQLVERST